MIFVCRNYTSEAVILDKMSRAVRLLKHGATRVEPPALRYVILDLRDDDSWRPLIRVERGNNISVLFYSYNLVLESIIIK